MATDEADRLATRPASEVLRDTDRVSVGVVRILSDDAGAPGAEREYEAGDEALVEAGRAEWVVAPVHSPEAGRRLDGAGSAEREATPRAGIEVYPPAEPTVGSRRAEARTAGFVAAHTDDGVGERLAAKRAELARGNRADGDGDVELQASLGGRGARSGPVTAASDLPADSVPTEDAPDKTGTRPRGSSAKPKE